jgi:hypothetical protein
MDAHIAGELTRWRARTLVIGLTTSMLAITICAAVFAQAPPLTKGAPQPKAGDPGAEAQSLAAQPQQSQVTYSPWTALRAWTENSNRT